MSDDIDFRQAMKGVKRLKKESVDPHTDRRPSSRTLREQIQQRARDSQQLLENGESASADQGYPGHSNREEESQLFYLRQGVQKRCCETSRKARATRSD